jgi:hypothetical protein
VDRASTHDHEDIAVRRRIVWCGAVAALCGLGVASVGAHGGLQAVVEFRPSPPVSGQPVVIAARFVSDGRPMELAGFRVRIAAEMTGHAMPPVESVLTRTDAGDYRGTATFIMSGEWIVTVFADSKEDPMIGRGRLVVGAQGKDLSRGGPLTIDMSEPPATLWLSPWPVVFGAVALVLALEVAAIGRKLARRRRSGLSTA